MGDNTLSTQVTGTTILVDGVNQYKTALNGDLVPRNTSGAATDEDGSLGTDALKWLKAHIASGYWDIGDIKPHHTYNGSAPVGDGWYPCDGTIINETNYDAIHGAGSWDTYVVASALDGKYAPNLTGKYLTGSASTTQDGTSGITSVGNSSNVVNLQHSHTNNAHNHQWYDYESTGGTGEAITTTNTGAYSNKTYDSSGNEVLITTSGAVLTNEAYTKANTTVTDAKLATDQSIQPESIEVIYYIRVI